MISALHLLFALMPFVSDLGGRHWFFRSFEFLRLQIFTLQVMLLVAGFFFADHTWLFFASTLLLVFSSIYQATFVVPYLPFNRKKPRINPETKKLSVLVSNVFMDNEDHQKLVKLIEEHAPDIFLTMESDQKWQASLDKIQGYDHCVKVPQDNTYGMHLYSKLPIHSSQTHHLVKDDIPCIQAKIDWGANETLTVFCFHPEPPSPTEAETSTPRDLGFKKLAEIVNHCEGYKLVLGDFNSVAWSKPTRKFIREAGLADPRMGRGLHSTFHADYFFFRFPIDQLLHDQTLSTSVLKVLPHIGSDHFPLYGELRSNAKK